MPPSSHQRLKILFVCGRNQKRSPTAAKIYQHDPRVEVRSGRVSESSWRRVSAPDLAWADLVVVMERKHAGRLSAQFPELDPEVVTLEIPDDYEYLDVDLVELLRQSVEPLIEERRSE